MPYAKILMPHDGSPLADAAIAHVSYLASTMGAAVLLLRVTETVGQELAGYAQGAWVGEAAADVATENVEHQDMEAEQALATIKATFVQAGVPRVSIMVVEGLAGPSIVEIAATEHCDLIVMATHGRSGLQRAVLGSVADHVVRNATCPVLLVRPAGLASEKEAS